MTPCWKCHFRCVENTSTFSREKRPPKTVLRERCGTERSPDTHSCLDCVFVALPTVEDVKLLSIFGSTSGSSDTLISKYGKDLKELGQVRRLLPCLALCKIELFMLQQTLLFQ